MHFKEFITRQRVGIFIIGVITFIASLSLSHFIGFNTLTGALFINLAASSITIVFTALIIDYLNVKEQSDRTHAVAGLAEDEIRANCFRINWRLARLFGLERDISIRDKISSRDEARDYLETVTNEVEEYLAKLDFINGDNGVHIEALQRYLDRLQSSQLELEQTLVLYNYALSYSLRERVLTLRSELQIAERLLGFIDMTESLTEANLSLIRITAQSVYNVTRDVLQHDSRTVPGQPIHAKESRIQ
jgi:uncharacterized protein YqfB (UPF0267 family)